MLVFYLLLASALLLSLAAVWLIHRNRKYESLGQKTAKKIAEDESIHIIVHELRAPVVAIKESASVMLSDNMPKEEETKLLSLIHEQAGKLLDQISKILDSAKVEEGKLVLNKAAGNLSEVIKNEMDLFMPEARRKNIKLTASVEENLPVFFFDSVRITEAINNLISNSLKYTNDNGSVTISVVTDDTYRKTKSGGNVMISVADTGIGISEEKQHMLFQKFTDLNANASTEAKTLSSGLGLYITKGIIQAHGGLVTINSIEGKGTTVTFNLPIRQN